MTSAEFFVGKILRPDDKPIVFTNEKWPLIGAEARDWLQKRPDELQYFRLLHGQDSNSRSHTPDRIMKHSPNDQHVRSASFSHVEFDTLPLADQLKILWWLKRVQKWETRVDHLQRREVLSWLVLCSRRA